MSGLLSNLYCYQGDLIHIGISYLSKTDDNKRIMKLYIISCIILYLCIKSDSIQIER